MWETEKERSVDKLKNRVFKGITIVACLLFLPCFMTKKLTQVLTKSSPDVYINNKYYFVEQIAQLDCTTLNIFDESGVKITPGYRIYGNSYIGEPAIEFMELC